MNRIPQDGDAATPHWQAVHLPEENIVQAKGYGPMTLPLLAQMASQARAVASQAGINRFLYDHREATFVGPMTDILHLPFILSLLGFTSSAKLAALAPPEALNWKGLELFQTRMCNCGYQARLFSERAEALRWLQQPVRGTLP